MIKFTTIIILFFIFIDLPSQSLKLRNGDLLFQKIDCGSFCEAIEKVTPSYKGNYVNHVGIVLLKDNKIFVLEAISKGVVLTHLDTFILRSNKIFLGRVPKRFLPKNIEIVKFLHKPYDSVFDIYNDAFYCSELVYFLYKNKRNSYFFTLKPMTFKELNSENFLPAWEEYFNKMNVPIPEGKPGINPGDMMNEKNIKIKPFLNNS